MYSHYSVGEPQVGALDTHQLIEVLTNSWETRVAVKTSKLDLENYYDKSIPDYPPGLVPFLNDPRYQSLSIDIRQLILAGAWIAYNEKTISVETSVVAPACELLLKGRFPGADSAHFKRIIAQTSVDEQFHILMSLEACLVARKVHKLESMQFPKAMVVEEIEAALKNAATPREAEIIQLAFATIAEVTINAYLNLLANDKTIQPLNRETTSLHRKDESSHNKIFREITKSIYPQFNQQEKTFYLESLGRGLDAFVRTDLKAWLAILKYLHIQDADNIIEECLRNSKRSIRDYSGLIGLLKDIDVNPSAIPFDFNC